MTHAARRLWRFVHNAIAHPLLEILPERAGTWLHDETARRAFEPIDPAPVAEAPVAVEAAPVDLTKPSPRLATHGIAGGRFYADLRLRHPGEWRVGDELVIDGHRVRVNRISPPFAYAEEILPENPS